MLNVNFENFCEINKMACLDENIFNNFKRTPQYLDVLEHVSFQQAKDYINEINKTNGFLLEKDFMLKFSENDKIGNPYIFDFNFGKFSTTVFRYIKVLSDLINYFGDLNGFNIVEIGAGNGGQCNIISKYFNYNTYTIFDLPDVMNLQEKCLKILKTPNVIFKELDNKNDLCEYDLVISNYAFSELQENLRYLYLDNVLQKSKRGYLTMNDGLYYNFHKNSLKKEIKILEEIPKTGKDNYIVVW